MSSRKAYPYGQSPPPELVGIQNTIGNYLSVCGECNGIPGVSVDLHAVSVSSGGGSEWQMISMGPNIVAFLNTLTNTYLSVCEGCNGIPGFSVDVHATSPSGSALWKITPGGGIMSTLTNTYLSACYKCPKNKNGYSVDVHATSPSVGADSTWSIQDQGVGPSPIPYPPFPNPVYPPLTPLVPMPPGPSPLYPPLTPLGPMPPGPPSPSPLYPPLTPLGPMPPGPPSPSPLYPPLTPLVPPSPTPPSPPSPTPLNPPLTPLTPLPDPSNMLPLIYQSPVHPKWAFYTAIAFMVLGLLGLLIGLFGGIGVLSLLGAGLIIAAIVFFVVYLRY